MTENKPEFLDQWINLAQPRLGAEIVSCSDDFFVDEYRRLWLQHATALGEKIVAAGNDFGTQARLGQVDPLV